MIKRSHFHSFNMIEKILSSSHLKRQNWSYLFSRFGLFSRKVIKIRDEIDSSMCFLNWSEVNDSFETGNNGWKVDCELVQDLNEFYQLVDYFYINFFFKCCVQIIFFEFCWTVRMFNRNICNEILLIFFKFLTFYFIEVLIT